MKEAWHLAVQNMGTSSKTSQSSPFGAGTPGKRGKNTGEKKDWTFWFIIGVVVLFVVIVACVYFVKKYNATDKAYIKVGEHEINQVEFDYYYNTMTNNYLSQNSNSLLFMGIDASKPLDEQTCIYDSNLSWKDYFMQSTVPVLQSVKALCDDAKANNFEYDVTDDYNSYISTLNANITAANVSKDYYYEQNFGKYATQERLEPIVKEYLMYQAYYNKLTEDNAATDEAVKAEYEANPEKYDTIDYHLYSMVAQTETEEETTQSQESTADGETTESGETAADETSASEPTEEEKKAALDEAQARAEEMLKRYEDGEDWRELCYEYANDKSKENFDPEKESDSTAITGGTSQTISANYFDWLADESRKAGDGMVYRDEDNNACFIVVFDKKTAYDLEADSSNIADTLTSEKVQEYIDNLTADYEVTDMGNHLKYLHNAQEETDASSGESGNDSQPASESDSPSTAETETESDSQPVSETAE